MHQLYAKFTLHVAAAYLSATGHAAGCRGRECGRSCGYDGLTCLFDALDLPPESTANEVDGFRKADAHYGTVGQSVCKLRE